ncbi:MAG: class I SAM-dependent methyltransferase [Alphaproteobacteria bacterium]
MLRTLLRRLVKSGTLKVVWPDGHFETFGSGAPSAAIRLHGRFTPFRLGLKPDLAFGEAYMNGRLTVEEGDIGTVFEVLMSGIRNYRAPIFVLAARTLRFARRRLSQFNPRGRARRNARHHYDLSGELYSLFLDSDRQYSCAYFREGGENIELAQIAKKRHIAAKLHLNRPGLKVLDIGSGWGGLALDLARDAKADVLGITLSQEQLAFARERTRNAGLANCCRFELEDYRRVRGEFDRIVSVGMFEHVGLSHFRAFFRAVHDALAPGGVALLHTIGRTDGPGVTNPWINKYIFPGGYSPALSEMVPVIEKCGLIIADVEVLRLHYAETLKQWRDRFRRNWAKAAALYDERFCRMWDFYLAGAETSFRKWNVAVFQIQLVKSLDALPITRDYMFEAERGMRFSGIEPQKRGIEAA